ncbi:glycosyltransferase family 2 protein [Methanosarcina mazei]|uniref:glycosyltransferase family 2 protein n=1 Tax=Methanosarcina mazei TaxID=2209 RepID=UPI001F1A0CF7|nr:glycosyltransferase [Methanosarcina mazei]
MPTYNRAKDLEDCLDSLFIQTVLPFEIIVVDNADNLETEKLINEKYIRNTNQISVKYIKNGKLNSANIARNIGADNSFGDFLLFLDDDIVLDPNFIEEIINVFQQYPQAAGVQGYIKNRMMSPLSNFVEKLFFLNYSLKNHNKLLPSMQDVHADPLTEVIRCQWLMAGCTCYKKSIFHNFRFDNNLFKYCSGDDADISYRIYKMHPHSLYQTPYATLIHKVSDKGRPSSKEVIITGQVYHTYLFFKNIDQNFRNKLIFVWSRIGLIITKMGVFVLHPSINNFSQIKCLIEAYVYCIHNIGNLKKGEIKFYTGILK